MSEVPAIRIHDLSYVYVDEWTRRSREALQQVSLEVQEGETFGFLGHNGAGKTSTIKCILNLIRPRHGRIEIFGEPSDRVQSRALVGYLPEQPYFYDHLTVQETLHFYASLAGVPSPERGRAVRQVMELVGMESRENSRMRALSKGLTQRVALAQAIIAQPKLLILDEPFSGLDPIGRKEFRDVLSQLKSQGTTIFMSSHVLSDVEFMCDRVSIMVRGVLKGVFRTSELPAVRGSSFAITLRNPERLTLDVESMGGRRISEGRFVRLEFGDRDMAERALASVISSGAGVESYEHRGGSLEELFVSLVQS